MSSLALWSSAYRGALPSSSALPSLEEILDLQDSKNKLAREIKAKDSALVAFANKMKESELADDYAEYQSRDMFQGGGRGCRWSFRWNCPLCCQGGSLGTLCPVPLPPLDGVLAGNKEEIVPPVVHKAPEAIQVKYVQLDIPVQDDDNSDYSSDVGELRG